MLSKLDVEYPLIVCTCYLYVCPPQVTLQAPQLLSPLLSTTLTPLSAPTTMGLMDFCSH